MPAYEQIVIEVLTKADENVLDSVITKLNEIPNVLEGSNFLTAGEDAFKNLGEMPSVENLAKNIDTSFAKIQKNKAFDSIRNSTRRFRFELLGVMFLAMQVSQAFGQWTQPALELTGSMDYLNMTMTLMTLGPASTVADTVIYPLADALNSLPQPIQDAIGWIIMIGKSAGDLLGSLTTVFMGALLFKELFPLQFAAVGTALQPIIASIGSTILGILPFVALAAALIAVLWAFWPKEMEGITEAGMNLIGDLMAGRWDLILEDLDIFGKRFLTLGLRIFEGFATIGYLIIYGLASAFEGLLSLLHIEHPKLPSFEEWIMTTDLKKAHDAITDFDNAITEQVKIQQLWREGMTATSLGLKDLKNAASSVISSEEIAGLSDLLLSGKAKTVNEARTMLGYAPVPTSTVNNEYNNTMTMNFDMSNIKSPADAQELWNKIKDYAEAEGVRIHG